jgi:hypothetical protein
MGEWMYRYTFFLSSALVGGEWSASRPGRFIPGERALGIHYIGGWVSRRAGLDDMEKRKFLPSQGLELRPLGCPARSQSLYRLLCPGSRVYEHVKKCMHDTYALLFQYLRIVKFHENSVLTWNSSVSWNFSLARYARVTFQMRAKIHEGDPVECPSILSRF